jgi:hypothetical protein
MTNQGIVTAPVKSWLKAEGLAVLILSVMIYSHSASGWWTFFGLLLAPDIAMLAYLVNPRQGAISYNLVHSYAIPLAIAAGAIAFKQEHLLPYLNIWIAHIGMDRALGYGLKYPAAFGVTHLGLLGKRATV